MTGREIAAANPNARRIVIPWRAQKNLDGQYLCKWCGTPVIAKNRRYWCSQDCVDEYRSVNDPNFIASRLLKRDRGICAGCGVNAEELQQICRGQRFHDLHPYPSLEEIAVMLEHDGPYQELTGRPIWRALDIKPDVAEAHGQAEWHWRQLQNEFQGAAELLRRECAAQGFPDSTSRRWWEADHIIEVVRGGGMRGLENYQTLCVPCHKAKTRRLAKERAQERRRPSNQLDLISA